MILPSSSFFKHKKIYWIMLHNSCQGITMSVFIIYGAHSFVNRKSIQYIRWSLFCTNICNLKILEHVCIKDVSLLKWNGVPCAWSATEMCLFSLAICSLAPGGRVCTVGQGPVHFTTKWFFKLRYFHHKKVLPVPNLFVLRDLYWEIVLPMP